MQRIALGVGVLDELLHVFLPQRVEHVPEVLALWDSSVGRRIRHILHEDRVLMHERPELLHRELIVLWHIDMLDRAELEQLLLLFE